MVWLFGWLVVAAFQGLLGQLGQSKHDLALRHFKFFSQHIAFLLSETFIFFRRLVMVAGVVVQLFLRNGNPFRQELS
jgi:hypothetical protein